MNKPANYRFIFSILWIGFLLAISFMEAPMKFQAELVTLPIGLSVGRVIFSMLNKIEWVLLGLLLIAELLGPRSTGSMGLSLTALGILLLQSFWLLPILDARAEAIVGGALLPGSNTHFYYLGMEVLKLTVLVLYTRAAIGLFQKQLSHQNFGLELKSG